MPPRTLRAPYEWFLEQNARHAKIAAALPGLDPALQKALAELVLIRLFDDLQEALAGMAYRLACGAPYVDLTPATLIAPPARSSDGARLMFETHNRPKTKFVKWSRTEFIKETVRHVVDSADPFVTACDSHALVIGEMQMIRNRIAHRNTNSRNRFNIVLRRYYGGTPTSVTPGLLLITPRASPTPLTRYLTATRVIVKECARA